MVKRSWFRWGAALLAVVLLAAACGDDGDDVGSPSDGNGGSSTTEGGTPQPGGTLTFGSFLKLAGFDPTMVNSTYGCCGGIELTAFYDVLLSMDPETGEYEGRVAESFEPNADFTSWTLKLRPDVKFADGTAYDAAAVKFNIERHLAPTSRSASRAMLTRFLGPMTVVDPLTLQIQLKEAWTGFPTLLAREVGMIASPTAIQAAGQNFAVAPGKAGAGPFLLSSFKPDEAIQFVKNPDYYGGEVYLDGLEFVALGAEQTSYESFKAGQLDVVFLRNPEVIANAESDGAESILGSYDPMGVGLILNSGVVVTCSGGNPELHCAGKPDGTKVTTKPPTADVRVRRAIAAAIDPEVVNQRVFDGKANATSELFPEEISWSPGVPGPEYDVDEAKRLVNEAKAAGWDGKLRVRAPSSTSEFGIAVETMLELAGIDVDLNVNEDTTAGVAAVLTRRDWDVASWSLGLNDDINNVFAQLSVSFQGDPTRYGYQSAELDSALDDLRVADDADARKAAMEQISTVLARDVPLVSVSLGENRLVHADDVHGIVLDAQARVFFDKAWIG